MWVDIVYIDGCQTHCKERLRVISVLVRKPAPKGNFDPLSHDMERASLSRRIECTRLWERRKNKMVAFTSESKYIEKKEKEKLCRPEEKEKPVFAAGNTKRRK